MSFSLRRQLFLIGLLTLSLPLLSINFVRETESALRDAQTGFLANIGEGIAATINPASLTALEDQRPAVFAHTLTRAPLLDGFSNDWLINADGTSIKRKAASEWTLGIHSNALWAYVEFDSPTTPIIAVRCIDSAGQHDVEFAPEAPGLLSAASKDANLRIRANWQVTAQRSRLEMRLPRSICSLGIGLNVAVDANDTAGEWPAVQRIVSRNDGLQATLQAQQVPDVERYVIDSHGWRVTDIVGARDSVRGEPSRDDTTAAIYRRLLGSKQTDLINFGNRPNVAPQAVLSALAGDISLFRATDTHGEIMSVAAIPLKTGTETVGALVVRQDSAAILTLNNPSLLRLTKRTILLTASVVGLLLVWATWVSWRIRRLARAAGTALDTRGRLTAQLPGQKARDEVGRLSRDFSALLQRLHEQQQWLQSLADKLSHELRTPMAVIQSSLENLAHSDLDTAQKTLGDRASSGVTRLHQILNAMSQANRAEQATRDAIFECTPLSEVVQQLAGAYASTFPNHRWSSDIEPNLQVIGNADLLVQMLDKLVDNAASFSPVGKRIQITLESRTDIALIHITNEGSQLPAGDAGQLFQTFMSKRDNAADASQPHLGFGLYIARLIAEAHDGMIEADNYTSGDLQGVRFSVTLSLGP
ncbi:MAG: ATP-binding protein [Woeseiaceae bacterium]